ncbi:MAG: low molecular weight phosphatase family protein [Gammaproteobacteria bacterium]
MKLFFICMGNYYRSRLAEELLSYYASSNNLQIEVDSGGLALNSRNLGAIAPAALKYLEKLNIIPKNANRNPKNCTVEDLKSSDYIICMQEEEQRELFEASFPYLKSRVVYWHVPDKTDDDTLELLHSQVQHLISSYSRFNNIYQ